MDHRRPDVVHATPPSPTDSGPARLLRQGHGTPTAATSLPACCNTGKTTGPLPASGTRKEHTGARHHHHRTGSDPALCPVRRFINTSAACPYRWMRPPSPFRHRRTEGVLAGEYQLQPYGSQHPQALLVQLIRASWTSQPAQAHGGDTIPFRC